MDWLRPLDPCLRRCRASLQLLRKKPAPFFISNNALDFLKCEKLCIKPQSAMAANNLSLNPAGRSLVRMRLVLRDAKGITPESRLNRSADRAAGIIRNYRSNESVK